MNVFNFLDEAIKGAIQFVFGFLHSTLLLSTRPLTGAKQLYVRSKAPDVQQISPPTYLALCILFATPFLLDAAGSLGLPVANFFTRLARDVAAGELGGFGPLVGGTIAGTIFLSAILRLLAWSAGLKGRRRDQLISVGEYQSGVIVLGFVVFAALLDFLTETDFEGMIEVSSVPAAAESVVFMVVFLIMFWAVMLPSIFAALGVWSAATRTGRPLLVGRMWFSWRRSREARRWVSWSEGRERRMARRRQLLGLAPGEPITLRRWMRVFGQMGLIYVGMLLSVLLAGMAVGGGAFATSWLLTRDQPPEIELIDLSCRVEGNRAMARAIAWNRSGQPQSQWAGDLDLEFTAFGPTDFRSGTAPWTPVASAAMGTDILAPGQIAEIEGPVGLSEEDLRFIMSHGNFGCRLAPSAKVAARDPGL